MGRITFPLMVVLALSGCAPARPPLSQPQAGLSAAAVFATVAAVRPIPALGGSVNDPQAAILAAMGVSVAPGGAASEIVLRRDDEATESVVQPTTAADLAPGERVMVVPGGSGQRLVPATPQS